MGNVQQALIYLSMTDTISYQYAAPSVLQRSSDQDELFLAKYSEIEKKEAPCFFWGKLTQPYMTARCLIALSNVVQSSFNLTPAQLSMLKDPIVTAGNERLRFEGFSNCAGVYARVDVLPDGHDGEFLENGTTNVDFNAGMISALGSISKQEKVVMSVGPKEVGLYNKGEKVIERKVPLPVKWIKGLTTVQIYQSVAERMYSFNRIQTLQLFQTLPKGTVKCDYYLVMYRRSTSSAPARTPVAICRRAESLCSSDNAIDHLATLFRSGSFQPFPVEGMLARILRRRCDIGRSA